jgi:tetratricopeptide (TPR) repeat protein
MKRYGIIILCLLALPVFAKNLNRYFEYIEQDQLDSVRSAIPQLIQRYPESPDVLYLSGLVETDGDKALLIYKDVLSQYPESQRADDALAKIIEYLYAKGLYNKTINYSKQLISKYPQSEQVDNCVYMLLCSFNVMNKRDSVDYYTAYYLKRYPKLRLPIYDNQVVSAYMTSDQKIVPQTTVPRPVAVTPVVPTYWALQVGAFGNPQNALALKNRLSSYGYETYVQKIKGSSRDLLAVRVGKYSSQGAAEEAGNRLKSLHDINYIVVKRNSWE